MAMDQGLEVLRKRFATASKLEEPDATIDMLHGLHDFLIGAGFEYSEIRLLQRLLGALEDHQRGKPHPLIAVKKTPGRRGHEADNMFKCHIAVAVSVLVKAGRKKKQAFNEIAETLKHAGIDIPPTKIDNWHREISSERHAEPELTDNYRRLLEWAMTRDDIQEVAKYLVDTLQTMPREKL